MYTPPVFKSDRAASLAFVEARGFGTISAWSDGRPVASPLPFCLTYAGDGTPQIAFHVARNNPLARLADGRSPWLLTVNGPDAYVSADWYVSPDQVPTWLYQAVHLTGAVLPMSGGDMAGHLDMLSARFEDWLAPKQPWTTANMMAGRLTAMKNAILGFTMSVETVEGSFKLNQHKSEADYVAVATALRQQGDASAQAIAQQMVAQRPELHYMSDVFGSETAHQGLTP